jgi:hypothetical protein
MSAMTTPVRIATFICVISTAASASAWRAPQKAPVQPDLAALGLWVGNASGGDFANLKMGPS